MLMMAWMNAETLRMSLEQGRTVFWSRSRQEVWRKGDTSGDRQFIRSAHVRLRRRHAVVPGRAGGQRAPATPAATPASSGPSAPTADHRPPRPGLSAGPRHGRPLPRALPHPGPAHRVVPVWRDAAGRPDHAAGRLRPALRPGRQRRRRHGPDRVPAGVGRPRRTVEPVVVHRPRPAGARWWPAAPGSPSPARSPTASPPTGACSPRWRRCSTTTGRPPRSSSARRPAAAALRRGRLPRLRRGAGGRAPARRARRRQGLARRRAVGHRRAGRLRPLVPAGHAGRQRLRGARRHRRRARRRLRRRRGPARAHGRATAPPRSTSRW